MLPRTRCRHPCLPAPSAVGTMRSSWDVVICIALHPGWSTSREAPTQTTKLPLTWMGTMPAFFEMLMPVSPPVKLMQFTAGCVCTQAKDLSGAEQTKNQNVSKVLYVNGVA